MLCSRLTPEGSTPSVSLSPCLPQSRLPPSLNLPPPKVVFLNETSLVSSNSDPFRRNHFQRQRVNLEHCGIYRGGLCPARTPLESHARSSWEDPEPEESLAKTGQWNKGGGRGAWVSESGCRSLDQRGGCDAGPPPEKRRWPVGSHREGGLLVLRKNIPEIRTSN